MCFYAENRLLWLHVLLEHSSVYSLPFDTHLGGDQGRMSHLLCAIDGGVKKRRDPQQCCKKKTDIILILM